MSIIAAAQVRWPRWLSLPGGACRGARHRPKICSEISSAKNWSVFDINKDWKRVFPFEETPAPN
jgi:hypothetical protein